MARVRDSGFGYSDPASAEAASVNRFKVWDQPSDPYDHDHLVNNWDKIDAMFGRPDSGVAWPSVQGVGGGVWREIRLLQKDRGFIGEVSWLFYPFTGTETASQIEAKVPAGWVICDGRQVAAADHDFGTGAAFYTPDLRGAFVMGATKDVVPGTASTADAGSETYPGVVRGTVSGNVGGAGSNFSVDATITIPDHFHWHDHTHAVGGISSTETNRAPGGDFDVRVARNLSGDYVVSTATHAHQMIRLVSSSTRGPGHPDRLASAIPAGSSTLLTHAQTSLQVKSTGGTESKPTGSATSGNSNGQSLSTGLQLDKRPKHVGLLPIMRVKYATTTT